MRAEKALVVITVWYSVWVAGIITFFTV
jgi:hypothetical protein